MYRPKSTNGVSRFRFPGAPAHDSARAASTGEVAWAPTAHGELSLRRWPEPGDPGMGYEITLNDVCLSSSQFAVGGTELVRRAFAGLGGERWHVAVIGLGLGFTACAVLDDRRVASLLVVEEMSEVADWARAGLYPNGARITADRRARLVVEEVPTALGPPTTGPGSGIDAVIFDVAHRLKQAPGSHHGSFLGVESLRRIATTLRPGGVIAVWSDLPPDTGFLQVLRSVFDDVVARPLAFENPVAGLAVHTMYVAC